MGQCLCLKLYNWENHKENWIETGRKLMGFCSSHQDWWLWLGLSPKLQSVSPCVLVSVFCSAVLLGGEENLSLVLQPDKL